MFAIYVRGRDVGCVVGTGGRGGSADEVAVSRFLSCMSVIHMNKWREETYSSSELLQVDRIVWYCGGAALDTEEMSHGRWIGMVERRLSQLPRSTTPKSLTPFEPQPPRRHNTVIKIWRRILKSFFFTF